MNLVLKNFRLILNMVMFMVVILLLILFNPLKEHSAVKTNFLLNTLITIKAYGYHSEAAVEAAMDKVTDIENKMSSHLESSEIWQINHEGYSDNVSQETLEVIHKGLYYSRLTNGCFDITIKPLMDLWQIGTENARVPRYEEINSALQKVDYRALEVDRKQYSVKLTQQGMGLDLGGIAKGHAADEIIRILKEYGIKRAYADLGGNIIILGKKKIGWTKYIMTRLRKDQMPLYQEWRIGIQDPLKSRGVYMAVIEASDKAIVTSGPYERNFKKNGIVYHHILDPFTGYPAQTNLISITIVADKSIDADALSTSVFLLGEDKGLQLIEAQPGIEAMTINKDRVVHITSGLVGKVKIVDATYTLK